MSNLESLWQVLRWHLRNVLRKTYDLTYNERKKFLRSFANVQPEELESNLDATSQFYTTGSLHNLQM